MSPYQLIVVGASAGGLEAIITIFSEFPENFSIPIVIVQHQAQDTKSYLSEILNKALSLKVMEAEDKLSIKKSTIYLAPAGYHLQIEQEESFSLSVDKPVHYSRPSIDVLFESAANVYNQSVIGVLLTGANGDGAEGLQHIENHGGFVMVQDPSSASSPEMPTAGIELTKTTHIYALEDIGKTLLHLCKGESYD